MRPDIPDALEKTAHISEANIDDQGQLVHMNNLVILLSL